MENLLLFFVFFLERDPLYFLSPRPGSFLDFCFLISTLCHLIPQGRLSRDFLFSLLYSDPCLLFPQDRVRASRGFFSSVIFLTLFCCFPRAGAELLEVLQTNVVGVHLTTAYFLPLVRKGQAKKIINISTTMSSISGNLAGLNGKGFFPGHFLSYRTSKAALNMGENPCSYPPLCQ